MAFEAISPVGADFDAESSTAKFALGTQGRSLSGVDFVYAKANEAIGTQWMYVTIDEAGLALKGTKAAVDDGHQVAIAPITFTSGYYGWFITRAPVSTVTTNAGDSDSVKVRVAASCNADVALYTSGTAGVLDDASTSQTKVEGIVATTAVTAAAATEVIITYPRSATF